MYILQVKEEEDNLREVYTARTRHIHARLYAALLSRRRAEQLTLRREERAARESAIRQCGWTRCRSMGRAYDQRGRRRAGAPASASAIDARRLKAAEHRRVVYRQPWCSIARPTSLLV